MKKVLALSCLLLTLGSGAAMAQDGISLAWDNCSGSGASNKNYVCDGVGGPFALVIGVDTGIMSVGMAATIDVDAEPVNLPLWWDMRPTGCSGRTGAEGLPAPEGQTVACTNEWAAQSISSGANAGLPQVIVSKNGITRFAGQYEQAGGPLQFTSGTHSYAMTVTITGGLGTGCTGCSTPACIALQQLVVTDVDDVAHVIDTPISGHNQFVTWQGGTPQCTGATPTRNATWGSIKALYR